jgi:hypothetical protein
VLDQSRVGSGDGDRGCRHCRRPLHRASPVMTERRDHSGSELSFDELTRQPLGLVLASSAVSRHGSRLPQRPTLRAGTSLPTSPSSRSARTACSGPGRRSSFSRDTRDRPSPSAAVDRRSQCEAPRAPGPL